MTVQGFVADDGKKYIGCPLCDEALLIKTSKKGRSYFTCQSCGLQMFLRYDVGERRLEQILSKGADNANDSRISEWI